MCPGVLYPKRLYEVAPSEGEVWTILLKSTEPWTLERLTEGKSVTQEMEEGTYRLTIPSQALKFVIIDPDPGGGVPLPGPRPKDPFLQREFGGLP